jgi:hypothetical protein
LLTGQTISTSSPGSQQRRRIDFRLSQPTAANVWFILSCSSAIIALAFVVMIVNVHVTVPSGHLSPSRKPANAIG